MWEFEAIGTHWTITCIKDRKIPDSLQTKVLSHIEEFDRNYSRFRTDSLVSEMARMAGTYTLPVDAAPLMELYKDLYDLTGGAFTPLIGQVLSDAGYDSTYSLKPRELITPPTWDDVLIYDSQNLTLTLKKPALLDFGAAGKGYLVDIIAELLRTEGIHTFCVNAGGDIRYENSGTVRVPLEVGLEHPDNFSQVVGIASISDGSICGSAGNRRSWGVVDSASGDREFHHVIHPHSLASPKEIKAVWVTAETAILADALTTCLFFVPAESLTKYSFEYLVITSTYQFEKSPDFPAKLFTQ